MKKHIDLIVNGKGGVGKSFLAANIYHLAVQGGFNCLPVDTDHENASLKRYCPDAYVVNLSRNSEIDSIFERLLEHSLLVIDWRSASTQRLLDYFTELNIFDLLNELETSVSVFLPVGNEIESLKQAQMIVECFGSNCQYVIVKNQFLSESFQSFETSSIRRRMINQLRSREVFLPKMDSCLIYHMSKAEFSSCSAVEDSGLSFLEKRRLQAWSRSLADQLGSITHLLAPSELLAKAA